jgi:hypothetical protein
MILIGILMIVSSLAVFILRKGLNSNHAVVILLSVLILSTAGMVVNSFRHLRNM